MVIDESLFIKCECGGCNILEFEFDNEYGQFNISIWGSSYSQKPLSKKERIRWCDNITKTGMPWADHIIMSKTNAVRLTKFINKKLTQYGKANKNRSNNGRTNISSGE